MCRRLPLAVMSIAVVIMLGGAALAQSAEEPATIGGRLWHDVDADGIQGPDETEGIEGIEVALYSGVAEAGNDPIATAVTDSSGQYAFTDLPPGDYSLTLGPGALVGTEYGISPFRNRGDNDAVDSDGTEDGGHMGVTTLEPGEVDTTWDLGLYLGVRVAGTVFEDLDRDGVRDEGEPGIPGVSVMFRIDDHQEFSHITPTDGGWAIDISPAELLIRVVVPDGWELLSGGALTSTDGAAEVSLNPQSGGDVLGLDVGLVRDQLSETGLSAGGLAVLVGALLAAGLMMLGIGRRRVSDA